MQEQSDEKFARENFSDLPQLSGSTRVVRAGDLSDSDFEAQLQLGAWTQSPNDRKHYRSYHI